MYIIQSPRPLVCLFLFYLPRFSIKSHHACMWPTRPPWCGYQLAHYPPPLVIMALFGFIVLLLFCVCGRFSLFFLPFNLIHYLLFLMLVCGKRNAYKAYAVSVHTKERYNVKCVRLLWIWGGNQMMIIDLFWCMEYIYIFYLDLTTINISVISTCVKIEKVI
jgi:hypothetical protein